MEVQRYGRKLFLTYCQNNLKITKLPRQAGWNFLINTTEIHPAYRAVLLSGPARLPYKQALKIVVSYAACSRVRGFLPTNRLLTTTTLSIPIVSTWPIRKRHDVGFPPNSVVTN
jgi:hypothetical protein